jgi:TonB family protein
VVFIHTQIEGEDQKTREPEGPILVELLDKKKPELPKQQFIKEPESTEPRMEFEDVLVDQPQNEIISDTLGLDTDAAAGSDAFGLQAKKGGRSIMDIINETRSPPKQNVMHYFGAYVAEVENYLQSELNKREKLHQKKYTARVKVWVNEDGRVTRCQLYYSTGSRDTDELLINALNTVGRLPGPPPTALPQPIKLQITTHTG